MDALRKSLDRVSDKRKAPAKAVVANGKAAAAPKRKRAAKSKEEEPSTSEE